MMNNDPENVEMQISLKEERQVFRDRPRWPKRFR
jgi:hypothetical protein